MKEVNVWLFEEQKYACNKWPDSEVDKIDPSAFEDWISQYVHRAIILGLDSANGRQALAKCLMTTQRLLESSIRRFGPLPVGGFPSGEIQWLIP